MRRALALHGDLRIEHVTRPATAGGEPEPIYDKTSRGPSD
jgi:hypothetical protein